MPPTRIAMVDGILHLDSPKGVAIMPVYTCTIAESTLSADTKRELAGEIARIHSSINHVPSTYVNVAVSPAIGGLSLHRRGAGEARCWSAAEVRDHDDFAGRVFSAVIAWGPT